MNNLPNKTSRRRLTSLLFVGLALSTFYARSFYYHELDAFLVIEHSGGVQCASFSPDGFRILTATGDGNAILWDMATLRRNRNGKITPGVSGIMRHESPVHCAIFSPYEKYITSLSDSGAVSLWNPDIANRTSAGISTLQRTHQFIPPGYSSARSELSEAMLNPLVDNMAFHKEYNWLLTFSGTSDAWVWDMDSLPTGVAAPDVKAFLPHESTVTFARFRPGSDNKQQVVTASDDGQAILWNLDEPDYKTIENSAPVPVPARMAVMEHSESISYFAFSTNGSLILTTSSDDTSKLWDLDQLLEDDSTPTKPLLKATLPHDGDVLYAAFSPDSRKVVTVTASAIRLWDIENPKTAPDGKTVFNLLALISDPVGNTGYAAFSADSHRLLTLGEQQNATIWNVDELVLDENNLPIPAKVAQVVFSAGQLRASLSPGEEYLMLSTSGQDQGVWNISRYLSGHGLSLSYQGITFLLPVFITWLHQPAWQGFKLR